MGKNRRDLDRTPIEERALLLEIDHGRHFPHAIDVEGGFTRGEQGDRGRILGLLGSPAALYPLVHLRQGSRRLVEIVAVEELVVLAQKHAILLVEQAVEDAPHGAAIGGRDRKPHNAIGGQLGKGGIPVGNAIETFGLAVIAEQARGLQQRLVVVQNDRVDIERHCILLAVGALGGLPVGGFEIARLNARRSQFGRRDLAQGTGRDAEGNARFMIGHDIGALADGGRGLHLGVERGAPIERGRLDFDSVGVFLVELVDQGLHANAVAAAEEIPPDDGVLGLRRGERGHSQQRRRNERRLQNSLQHVAFLPINIRWLARALWLGTLSSYRGQVFLPPRHTKAA